MTLGPRPAPGRAGRAGRPTPAAPKNTDIQRVPDRKMCL